MATTTQKISEIGNITLTTSLQAVTVGSGVVISTILFGTAEGSDYEIALDSGATETFLFSNDRGSSPISMNFGLTAIEDRTIFYVKGTAGHTFQYMALRDI